MSLCHGFVKTYSITDMIEEIFMIDYGDVQGLETQNTSVVFHYRLAMAMLLSRPILYDYKLSIILQCDSFGKRVVASNRAASMRNSGYIASFFLE